MKSTARGSLPEVQKAAQDANSVQNAVNLVAILGNFREHLREMRKADLLDGDEVNNHPVTLAFVSKLNSLCRMTPARESAAFEAIDKLANGETVEYEVIPL